MSDMPKALRTAAGYRWVLILSAVLLSVVTGVLAWNEVASGGSSALRALVQSVAIVAWVAVVALCVAIMTTKAIMKAIHREAERAKQDILGAICERRLGPLADLMEEDNIRSIHNSKRR